MRVVIAEDQVLLREGLVRLFGDAGEEVVAAVGDAEALLRAVAAEAPELAVVDIRMPPMFTDEGARAARRLREDTPTSDLPLGGLWIGLPLGVAAIVLGVRARRDLRVDRGRAMATVAIVLAALAIGQMIVWSAVSVLSYPARPFRSQSSSWSTTDPRSPAGPGSAASARSRRRSRGPSRASHASGPLSSWRGAPTAECTRSGRS
ncbi:hypothetical protein BH20ACT18_BH20ACT18_05680 [soil metagenome]